MRGLLVAGVIPALLLGLGLAGTARGQQPGLPALPPYHPRAPHDSMLFADRQPVTPVASQVPSDWGSATLVRHLIPGAGTGISEPIEYQLPGQYNPQGPAHPMLVAWHGFGSSAGSVAVQTNLDEECNARRWVYLSITGLDDKLFGTPKSQRHVDVAIAWMLEQFHVDPDRICMVGFSMGGGAAMNYAARHHNPHGIMLAAVGAVGGGYDCRQTWVLEPATRPWLEHAFNFGGPPDEQLFRYQQASSLYHAPSSYPPLPGEPQPVWSLATNLGGLPVYLTWDSGDSISYVPGQNEQLVDLLTAQGTPVTQRIVSGTVDPLSGHPATHSWAVLDESALMDVFAHARVDRRPRQLRVQADGTGSNGWVDIRLRQLDEFAWLEGSSDPESGHIDLTGVVNAKEVVVHLADAGQADGASVALSAGSADEDGFALRLAGAESAPSYLVDTASGELLTGTESDPATRSVSLDIGAGQSVELTAHSVPWRGELLLAPDPAPPGASVELSLAGPDTAHTAWLLAGLSEALTPLPFGLVVTVSPFDAVIVAPLGLDPAGQASASFSVPADPGLSGARILLQAVLQGPGTQLADVTNAFAFDVE